MKFYQPWEYEGGWSLSDFYDEPDDEIGRFEDTEKPCRICQHCLGTGEGENGGPCVECDGRGIVEL